MNKTLPVIFLLSLMLFALGCSKDQEKVDQLEQEVMEAESKDYLTDSTGAEVTEVASAESSSAETPDDLAGEDMAGRSYAPTGSGGFTVQIASGTNRTYANYLADQFIGRGYEAFVTEVYIDDVSYFRVRIGSVETYEEAEALARELQDRYSVNFWIDNNI